MGLPDVQTFVALLAALALYVCLRNIILRPKLHLPPGPKGLPLLGNLLDFPVTREYLTYEQWGKEYGDVVYVNALGKNILILTSTNAARELLDVRSAIYSDRPFVPMVHDPRLMDSNRTFILKPYSPEWRRQRRLFSLHLGPSASRAFYETQTASTHTLLRSMLYAPEQFMAHLRYSAAETILSITYGYQVQPKDDPLVALAEYIVKTVGEAALPGRFLVNIFPWLKYVPAWVPGAGFKAHAVKVKKGETELAHGPFDDAKRKVDEGMASPSFVTNALTDPSPNDRMQDILATASSMYGAAADTTVSTMHYCILAFVLYPEVQARAQRELDSILGSVTSPTFRLPTFADREDLPYIDAIIKESLRWMPVAPIAIPHSTTEDDVYRGWKIPKGTIVIPNTWSMLHNKNIYSDPLDFRPERFIGDNPEPHPSSHGCFGFGRRECPGQHLAEASLWIVLSNLLAAFSFSPAKDKNGQDIDVNYARNPPAGLVLHPYDFPCKITPRSKEAEMRIRETHPDGEWSS